MAEVSGKTACCLLSGVPHRVIVVRCPKITAEALDSWNCGMRKRKKAIDVHCPLHYAVNDVAGERVLLRVLRPIPHRSS